MIPMIDTNKTVNRFRDSGFQKKEAEAVTEVLKDVQQEIVADLVSKDYLDQKLDSLEQKFDQKLDSFEQKFDKKLDYEIALLRKDMEQGNDLLRKDMKQDNALIREEMKTLSTKMDGKFNLLYWMLALIIGVVVLPQLKDFILFIQSL